MLCGQDASEFHRLLLLVVDLSDGRLRLFSYGPVRVLNQDRERICARRQTAFAECFGGEAPDIDVFALDNVCQWTQGGGVMQLGQRDRNPELICCSCRFQGAQQQGTGRLLGEVVESAGCTVAHVAVLIRQQLNQPTHCAIITDPAERGGGLCAHEPVVVAEQLKQRLEGRGVAEPAQGARAVSSHGRVLVIQSADDLMEIARVGLNRNELGGILADDAVAMTQHLRKDRLTAGEFLQRERRQINLFLAEQNHDAHLQERRGIGMLPKIILDHVQRSLDAAFVQQCVGLAEGGTLGAPRAAGEQQDDHDWNQTQHNECTNQRTATWQVLLIDLTFCIFVRGRQAVKSELLRRNYGLMG